MPDGAILVNVSHGPVVDTEALGAELYSHRLRAALDVTDPEPLPPEHPLWTAPNCFITPHTAGGRRDQDEALVRQFLANLQAWTSNQSMVDRIV
jgi:phosphoglycerate dehydrogenase-like enzyme